MLTWGKFYQNSISTFSSTLKESRCSTIVTLPSRIRKKPFPPFYLTSQVTAQFCSSLPIGRSWNRKVQPSGWCIAGWTNENRMLQNCFDHVVWDLFRISTDNNDEYVGSVCRFIKICVDVVVPSKKVKVYPNQKPWINHNVRTTLATGRSHLPLWAHRTTSTATTNSSRWLRQRNMSTGTELKHSCQGAWLWREDPDAELVAKNKIYFQKARQEQKARLSRVSKIFNCDKNNKKKQDKAMNAETRLDCCYKAKTWPDKTWRDPWKWGEDSAITEGNLETKYCGEVIRDGVQLWTKTADLSETKWQGKKHDQKLIKKPENKTEVKTWTWQQFDNPQNMWQGLNRSEWIV